MSDLRAAFLTRGSATAQTMPARGRGGMIFAGLAVVAYVYGLVTLGVTPGRLLSGVGELGLIFSLMMPPSPTSMEHFWTYLGSLGETLAIAGLGTMLAAVFALPLGFLAAQNVVTNRIVHILARRSLDTVRSVDTLVWALIWVNVVGLGPFAGALAIACTDVAALAKLMSEAIETTNRGTVEGVMAAGGGWPARLRFGVLPQILPVFLSQLLYFFESNTRSATIIGIVGAGGIGLYLSEAIRVLEWQEVAFLILMVLVAVAIIDALSRRLRGALRGPLPTN